MSSLLPRVRQHFDRFSRKRRFVLPWHAFCFLTQARCLFIEPVGTFENHPPAIVQPASWPEPMTVPVKTQQVPFVVVATDEDEDLLTFQWDYYPFTAATGPLDSQEDNLQSSYVLLTALDLPDEYRITVIVSDGDLVQTVEFQVDQP